jgi:hypothetical protein
LIPIDRDAAINAVRKMSEFHHEAQALFERYGMDLLDNLGRRNTLLSAVQEKFFSDALRDRFTVETDGSTGQPDIVVTDRETGQRTEIECKLTTRNKHGGVILQTDYDTLQRKGVLDYLYVVASPEFNEFCVLYFSGLTPEDFREPAPGSRGKSSMIKHRAYHKCTVLFGGYESLNRRNIERLEAALSGKNPPGRLRRLTASLEYWRNTPNRYEVTLERPTAEVVSTVPDLDASRNNCEETTLNAA